MSEKDQEKAQQVLIWRQGELEMHFNEQMNSQIRNPWITGNDCNYYYSVLSLRRDPARCHKITAHRTSKRERKENCKRLEESIRLNRGGWKKIRGTVVSENQRSKSSGGRRYKTGGGTRREVLPELCNLLGLEIKKLRVRGPSSSRLLLLIKKMPVANSAKLPGNHHSSPCL